MKRFVVVMILLASLTAVAVPAAAQQTQLTVGEVVEGTLESGVASEFTLSVVEGELYAISVVSADFDTLVEVRGPDGTLVTRDDDSGAGVNALGVFIASETADYNIAVAGFAMDVEGAFSVIVSQVVAEVSAAAPVDVDSQNHAVSLYSFTAADGYYDIRINTGNSLPLGLVLIDENGSIISSGDSVFGVDSAFRRMQFAAGQYYLGVVPDAYLESNVLIEASATLEVIETEARILGAEPTEFTLNSEVQDDIAHLTVEAGKRYEITVSSVEVDDFNLYLRGTDENVYLYANLIYSSSLGGSMIFVPEVSTQIEAQVSGGFYYGDEQNTFTITVVELGE